MPKDKHYWKEAYKSSWKLASAKEDDVKNLIMDKTGLTVEAVGLGAGSSDYIEGNAQDNNQAKGDADLYIRDKETYVEVTGPNVPVAFDAGLWIRPDKLTNTQNKLKNGTGKLHVVFHLVTETGTKQKVVRVIILDENFFHHLENDAFKKVTPWIEGKKETYIDIPAEHETVVSLEDFFDKLDKI